MIQVSGKVLGKEPEMRYSQSGEPVLTFNLAVYTGGNREKGYEPSLWIRVECWGPIAESWYEGLVKGAIVTVLGTPRPPRTYKNREGVEVPAGLEIRAKEILPYDVWKPDAIHPGEGVEMNQEMADGIPF